MSESESEDEILDRIEAALRKIAGVSGAVRQAESDAPDREALTGKLDEIITRLRDGLGGVPPRAAAPVPSPVLEELPLPEDAPAQTPEEPDEAPPEIWPEGE